MKNASRSQLVSVVYAVLVSLAAAFPPPESPVADAAMRGDVEAVHSLLAQGADVNAPQGDGMTALHWAAYNGDAELAKMLIYAGANLDAVTRVGGYTPLHLASKSGHALSVQALLEAGSDPNAVMATGVTPLHLAAASGSVAATTALLEHGAEIDVREWAYGQTPLIFASAYGRADAVSLLLERGANPGVTTTVVDVPALAEEDEALRERRSERLAILARTSEEGAGEPDDAEEDNREPDQAEEEDEEEAEKEAEEESEEEPEEEEGPERLSYEELVGRQGGLTAFHHAAREGHLEVVEALLDGGADIDQVTAGDHTSPLLIATINGHFDLAMHLLERGADPNLASDAGATPLYATINLQWVAHSFYPHPTDQKQQRTTYLELMKALLDAGADPNVRLEKHLWYMEYNRSDLGVYTWGATPFWRAAYGTDVEAMKLLMAYGADPSVPTRKPPQRRYGSGEDEVDPSGLPPVPVGGPGIYPIHAASGVGYGQGFAGNAHRHKTGGWLPSVRYLVEELGADVNARDLNGYTALHHAASRGDNELVLYLIEHGADVTVVSREGQTTADMANGPLQRVQPFPETVELLESLGSMNNHNCVSC